MTKRNVAAIIFINKRGEVLLQKKDLLFKRWLCRWSLFGGGISEDEDPKEALKREVKEEIGYDLDDNETELFTVYDYADVDRQGQMYIYTADFNAPISSISINEGAGFAFFSKDEIDKLNIIDHDMIILKKFFE